MERDKTLVVTEVSRFGYTLSDGRQHTFTPPLPRTPTVSDIQGYYKTATKLAERIRQGGLEASEDN